MAFDAFLKLSTGGNPDQIVIEGESTDKNHPNEIEVDSFSWGVSNTGSAGGSGGGGGKAALQDGTIHGLGSVMRGAEGHFVILGGTGRYAGAQGSYVARQSARELGGDGTAEFRLTLAG